MPRSLCSGPRCRTARIRGDPPRDDDEEGDVGEHPDEGVADRVRPAIDGEEGPDAEARGDEGHDPARKRYGSIEPAQLREPSPRHGDLHHVRWITWIIRRKALYDAKRARSRGSPIPRHSWCPPHHRFPIRIVVAP